MIPPVDISIKAAQAATPESNRSCVSVFFHRFEDETFSKGFKTSFSMGIMRLLDNQGSRTWWSNSPSMKLPLPRKQIIVMHYRSLSLSINLSISKYNLSISCFRSLLIVCRFYPLWHSFAGRGTHTYIDTRGHAHTRSLFLSFCLSVFSILLSPAPSKLPST